MRRFTLLTIALTSVVAFLIGVIVAGGLTPSPVVSSAPSRPVPASDVLRPGRITGMPAVVNFADVAERINAAVVNIDATSKTSRDLRRGEELDPGRDYEGPRQGSGSGFL